jgi:exopolysaccharide biosynthesis polyprenyl glycosylphosphotransferase
MKFERTKVVIHRIRLECSAMLINRLTKLKSNSPLFSGVFSSNAVEMLNDALILALAFVAAVGARLLLQVGSTAAAEGRLGNWNSEAGALCLLLFVLTFLWIAHQYGLYSSKESLDTGPKVRLIAQACVNTCLVLSGIMFLAHAVTLSREILIFFTVIACVTLSAHRYIAHASRRPWSNGSVVSTNLAILGTNQLSYALSQQLERNPQLQYNFLGFLEFSGCKFSPELMPSQVLGNISDLQTIKTKHFVEAIVIAEFFPYDDTLDLVRVASEYGIDVLSIAGYYDELSPNLSVEYLGVFPVSSLFRHTSNGIGLFFKRLLDIVISAAGLLMAAFPMLLIAALIVLDSRGSAFYSSDRIGRWGKPFKCFKFRTMILNAEALKNDLAARNERDEILFKLRNDPRVTRVGRVLRKYSLDELPQLFNVLRGEMSLVGPRPSIPPEVAKFAPEHLRRLTVLPGLTGLWQVKARQDGSFGKYISLDMTYVKNWSLWLDLKILYWTVDVVLRGTGV